MFNSIAIWHPVLLWDLSWWGFWFPIPSYRHQRYLFLSSCFPEGIAAKLLKSSVAVTDSTQYHMAKRHITGQWLPLSLRHVLRSACFQKSSISDFVKIKKPTQFQLLQNSKYIVSILWPDQSLFIFSDWLIQSIFKMSKTKGTNFFTVNALLR